MNYSNGKLLDMLMKLSINQIEEVREQHKKLYPESSTYLLLCSYAISLKKAEQKKEEFALLIEKVKNAPSDATNIE